MNALEWLGRWVGYLIVFTIIVVIAAVAKWAVLFLIGGANG